MAIVESHAPGTVSWVDLMTSDQDSAVEFYSSLFGWEVMKGGDDVGGYAMCLLAGEPVGGIGQMPDDADFPPSWTTYLATADIAATANAVTEAGGQVLMPVMEVAGGGQSMGKMAIFSDPTGGVVGVWEPGANTGFRRADEAGAVAWNELTSTDAAQSRAFLTRVFDHRLEQIGDGVEFDYTTVKVGDEEAAGVMQMPDDMAAAGVPSNWLTYFAVADTDAALTAVTQAGGFVMRPAQDSPYGRFAIVADPQGAAFAVISSVGESD